MADFSTLSEKIHNLRDAQHMLENFRIMYQDAKTVQSLLARYQSDPVFKSAVDYLYTVQQRAELAAMIAQFNALLVDWEENHPDVLGLDS